MSLQVVCSVCLYIIATGKSGLADTGNAKVRTTLPGCQVSSQLVDQPTEEL